MAHHSEPHQINSLAWLCISGSAVILYEFCAEMGMTYELSRLYELWYEYLCKPTWWTQKGMRYKGVWVIRAMGYEGVDCIQKILTVTVPRIP